MHLQKGLTVASSCDPIFCTKISRLTFLAIMYKKNNVLTQLPQMTDQAIASYRNDKEPKCPLCLFDVYNKHSFSFQKPDIWFDNIDFNLLYVM